jgi:hypothetical protein
MKMKSHEVDVVINIWNRAAGIFDLKNYGVGVVLHIHPD